MLYYYLINCGLHFFILPNLPLLLNLRWGKGGF